MRRGFKAEAERLAADLRRQLGLRDDQAVPLDALAAHLRVELVAADELVPRQRFVELDQLQADAFSAGTFRLPGGRRVIIHNPVHTRGRVSSDLAHELAHIILGHDVRSIERVGSLRFLTCDAEQEEEADWLAGCLLLPRPLLLRSASQGMTAADVAARFCTSESMARFRLNASGVLVQIGRAQAARRNRSQGAP
jgi:Zn-dependent peptidase ImmA (M78 family)